MAYFVTNKDLTFPSLWDAEEFVLGSILRPEGVPPGHCPLAKTNREIVSVFSRTEDTKDPKIEKEFVFEKVENEWVVISAVKAA